ncbi:MAG TPA: oxalyl-CoA decarboxylase, partial [Casimicrobiaceae bacterium]|nr:oxalyl-CoA decarboxylase [Casimicrobiaceae bacterium]
MESVTATRKEPVVPAAQSADLASGPASAQAQQEIDGFHLVLEGLKLNGIDTIFGLPGIPITD